MSWPIDHGPHISPRGVIQPRANEAALFVPLRDATLFEASKRCTAARSALVLFSRTIYSGSDFMSLRMA
ncbi:hypothetical protein NXT3_PB00221 (plasmid) [Sinorhizobium fredii]|uniref:Uncharacterized protein n=1 Tax=Rhizobium fredii TaxID=380 RepID=A0A2L0HBK5_RHIFR|nr:hypothetical protein NXT3_PB00221 [Sinorhizobium fredii]